MKIVLLVILVLTIPIQEKLDVGCVMDSRHQDQVRLIVMMRLYATQDLSQMMDLKHANSVQQILILLTISQKNVNLAPQEQNQSQDPQVAADPALKLVMRPISSIQVLVFLEKPPTVSLPQEDVIVKQVVPKLVMPLK